ncbi:MAG TPA: N-acetylmuramic acid 6-phosphate etherase, partial [Bacillales bacterium]|nr:N-acetylmuramic acid 6-phosphate etherase [Bacillales bacterium]
KGGRLFYVGAGTSGRLAVLDASECPPTFRVPGDRVQAVMAGGQQTFVEAEEGSEDNEQQGALDLKERHLTRDDVVVGITASGRTPYPIGALKYAKQAGCTTISLTCNQNSAISEYADCKIEAVVGPEVLTGSTRMKAGTAHKMILNMLSTSVMVKMGKVYENLMVDVHARNYKLRERAKQIVIDVTGVSYPKAEEILEETGQEVKPAIVMIASDVSFDKAKAALDENGGKVRNAIDAAKRKNEKP